MKKMHFLVDDIRARSNLVARDGILLGRRNGSKKEKRSTSALFGLYGHYVEVFYGKEIESVEYINCDTTKIARYVSGSKLKKIFKPVLFPKSLS